MNSSTQSSEIFLLCVAGVQLFFAARNRGVGAVSPLTIILQLSRAREEGFVKGGTEVLVVSNSPKELVDLMLDKLSKIDNSTLSDCP